MQSHAGRKAVSLKLKALIPPSLPVTSLLLHFIYFPPLPFILLFPRFPFFLCSVYVYMLLCAHACTREEQTLSVFPQLLFYLTIGSLSSLSLSFCLSLVLSLSLVDRI